MPDYLVSGRKGMGKSLVCVGKIEEKLLAGRKVATNLDLWLPSIVGKKNKSARYIRLKDRPNAYDLENLGIGNPTKDEKKNGILVLDEAGIWLNSRNWNKDKDDRQKILDVIAQLRKDGWDMYLLCQSLSQIDSQVREAFSENIVYCRRMDRSKIPIISFVFGLIGIRVRGPKIHVASVMVDGVVEETWKYLGTRLYSMYNTYQKFYPNCGFEMHSVLPPGYFKWTPKTKWNLEKRMKLTKIVLRKYSRVTAALAGALIAGLVSAHVSSKKFDKLEAEIAQSKQIQQVLISDDSQVSKAESQPEISFSEPLESIPEPSVLDGAYITGMMTYAGKEYYFLENGFKRFRSDDLESLGYKVFPRSNCEFAYRSLDGEEKGSIQCKI